MKNSKNAISRPDLMRRNLATIRISEVTNFFIRLRNDKKWCFRSSAGYLLSLNKIFLLYEHFYNNKKKKSQTSY